MRLDPILLIVSNVRQVSTKQLRVKVFAPSAQQDTTQLGLPSLAKIVPSVSFKMIPAETTATNVLQVSSKLLLNFKVAMSVLQEPIKN
jgi:hypothetical protein